MTRFKNVFILNTGRCGSASIIEACKLMENYSSGHETRCHLLKDERLAYPEYHIEADNRLSWFLGRLDKIYGDDAFYVHLIREKTPTAKSLNQRWGPNAIMRAYAFGIFKTQKKSLEYCEDYYETVNQNIRHFLKDKSHKMEIHLEDITSGFEDLWNKIHAEGDLNAAIDIFTKPRNTTKEKKALAKRMNEKIYHLKTAMNEIFS